MDLNDVSDELHAEPPDVHLSSVDLRDGFYQFATPMLSSWFSFGETYTADEAGVTEVFDEETQSMVAVEPWEELWACFAGLPMGWSWALHVCHSALEQCCERAVKSLLWSPSNLVEGAPFPAFLRKFGFTAPYVDS